MSENKKTVYDIVVSFQGLIGRQRKVQSQLLKTEDLEEKPSHEKAIEISKSLLDENKARSIHDDTIRITIQKNEIGEISETGFFSKTTMLFDKDWSETFYHQL
ncbi:hypothetical protein [Endozoicomonas sp. ALB091]|uniref:hypothetical protein n=1 Tax=Endozoicomonas sp. ALB091 TaxID=3403073 RepID=UPI003BB6553F